MDKSDRFGSIFSHEVDRAIYITYFLGSIVPLAALAWVVHRYALPSLYADGFATASLFFLVLTTGALSLAAFAALRRLTRSLLSDPARASAAATPVPRDEAVTARPSGPAGQAP